MSVTYRKDLDRDLTPEEVDANFETCLNGYQYTKGMINPTISPVIGLFEAPEVFTSFIFEIEVFDDVEGYYFQFTQRYENNNGDTTDGDQEIKNNIDIENNFLEIDFIDDRTFLQIVLKVGDDRTGIDSNFTSKCKVFFINAVEEDPYA